MFKEQGVAMSWWGKLKGAFGITRESLQGARSPGELEEHLIMADFGVKVAEKLAEHAKNPDELHKAMINILQKAEKPFTLKTARAPMVLLMIGVNGAGKTTTLAKLAHLWRSYKVGLVAADTFRHGAVEQLKVWSDRLNIPFYSGGSDAAAVAFDALTKAKQDGLDILLIDTSGRLHNQANLMDELAKIKRVIQKVDPTAPHETLLVLDGTTGQNALTQVEQFHQNLGLTGLIMTKLDGTAKGGMLFNITEKMGLPLYFLSNGESLNDLHPFEAEPFVQALLEQ